VQRGFKAKAETLSEEARSTLSLRPFDPLDPWDYAKLLKVAVVGADALDLPPQYARQLLEIDPGSWSGLTLGHFGETMVVLNSAQAQARQCSTLMHELAHIRLDHIPANVQISETGMLLLSDYSDDQEDEADWLMGALLLPRAALFQHRSRGQTLEQIAATYKVSDDLCRWRLRMTGVDAQLRFRR
jgi:hypothetical protein